jgi:hypothetical protein
MGWSRTRERNSGRYRSRWSLLARGQKISIPSGSQISDNVAAGRLEHPSAKPASPDRSEALSVESAMAIDSCSVIVLSAKAHTGSSPEDKLLRPRRPSKAPPSGAKGGALNPILANYGRIGYDPVDGVPVNGSSAPESQNLSEVTACYSWAEARRASGRGPSTKFASLVDLPHGPHNRSQSRRKVREQNLDLLSLPP